MMDTERTPLPDERPEPDMRLPEERPEPAMRLPEEQPEPALGLPDDPPQPAMRLPEEQPAATATDIYGFPVVDGADPVTGGGRYAGGYWQGHEPGGFDGSGVLVGAGAAASAEVRPGRVRTVFRETVETILLALLIFISVRSVIQNFKVEGSSMEPNLHSGQYLLVNKAAYWGLDLSPLASLISAQASSDPPVVYPFGAPNRGDVIVFRYPKDPRRDFIKRVIAVAGDKVEVQGSRVLVNGQMLSEPYIVDNPAYSKEATIVPPDHYYVLGDNRNNSSDSHVWGPVPREMIIGKAWLSYWPMSDWGLAPNYAVQAGQ